MEVKARGVLRIVGFGDVELDNVRRVGKKVADKIRPIQITLLRTMDKHKILKVKKNIPADAGVYITVEKTRAEKLTHKKLKEKGEQLKAAQPSLKYFIRNSQLTTELGNNKQTYTLNGSTVTAVTGIARQLFFRS